MDRQSTPREALRDIDVMSLRTSDPTSHDMATPVAAPAADTCGEVLEFPAPRRRAPRPCGPSDPLLILVYHDLDRQFDALQAALPQINGEDGVAGVHRARNATRRLRVTLKVFRDLLPDPPMRRLRSELSWLADMLGQVRDLDVHRTRLEQSLARVPAITASDIEPYLRYLEREHSAKSHALADVLAGERFARLSADFAAFLDREPSRAALRRSLGFSARDGAAEYAVRALRKLRRAGRQIGRRSSPEELHRFRIRCKRLRYQFESFEPVCEDCLRRPLKQLKRLQDSLGAHHDAVVATERLRTFTASLGMSDVSSGCRQALRDLIELETADAAASLEAFRHDWKRFEERVRPKKLKRKLQ
jgi:CHAD domain-containing protein